MGEKVIRPREAARNWMIWPVKCFVESNAGWTTGTDNGELKQPALANFVTEAMHHFDGSRYQLAAYVVMPNHVHLIVRPADAKEDGYRVDSEKLEAIQRTKNQRGYKESWYTVAAREFRSDHSRRRATLSDLAIHRSQSRKGRVVARCVSALGQAGVGTT